MLIALDAEGLLQFGRVRQVQIRAVVSQDAMPAPGQDFAVLTIEPVEIVARRLVQMDKKIGIDFLSGLTQSTIGRRQTQLSQGLKNFVERILKGEFVTSKN